MCKEKIEKAANGLDGVQPADWSSESKEITVVFNEAMVSLDNIKKAIAKVGHDTDGFRAKNKVYNKLNACCQYDRVLN